MQQAEKKSGGRTLVGTVVSVKMDKTIVVRVDNQVKHPLYEKVMRRSSKLYAHDEANGSGLGDVVRIKESRPLSKTKRWVLESVVDKAAV